MWGDPERAASLKSNDPLATILLQISSPAHIPWGDSRWQDLLHGYDVWVHMEDTDAADSGAVVRKACQSMAKHAAVSSNLAALSLHVTRMLRQLVKNIQQTKSQTSGGGSTTDFSKRISRVGKARATAGALQLLRLLVHPVVKNCGGSDGRTSTGGSPLEVALLYQTRGDLPSDQPAARPLVDSILDLIAATGSELCDALQTPEIYDATVIGVQLLLVLCGTQLYQPFQSSFQTRSENQYENYVLDEILRGETGDETVAAKNYRHLYPSSTNNLSSSNRDDSSLQRQTRHRMWTHSSILATCIHWQIQRPPAPEQSIAHYFCTMTQAAVAAQGGETLGRDGMYESYMIVHADAPTGMNGQTSTAEISADNAVGGTSHRRTHHPRSSHSVILDATKGAFLIGSSIIMLPFRLMSLVFGVIRATKIARGDEDAQHLALRMKAWKSSRTKDVLWLSDCILADLMTCFMLLVVNNQRSRSNPFRNELLKLTDGSWESEMNQGQGLPDLPDVRSTEEGDEVSVSPREVRNREGSLKDFSFVEGGYLSVKFDALYDAFGRTLHTEVGVLWLYTLYQACPSIAETMVVRSELDRLVLPLLRTLYFASNTQTYVANDFASARASHPTSTMKLDIRSFPFRSLSQLYVITILLLLFSQDTIFGRDAFRRIRISQVPWYKERNLRSINLGSVVLLTLLRTLLFNLHRLQDSFLLSNCCAVLQNLGPSIVDLHDYTAMRLASVTASVIKKHLTLWTSSFGQVTKEQKDEEQDFLTSSLSMYHEVAQALMGIIYCCLAPTTIERNLHLVYSLVYHQADFNRILNKKRLYASKLVERIQSVTSEASKLIQDEGARTASKALTVLEDQIELLQRASDETKRNTGETKRKKEREDIAFTYEEEADPEIFFVPYVWETIVCVVTSGTVEWKKDDIRAFALLDFVGVESTKFDGSNCASEPVTGHFSEDVGEVV